MVIRRLPILALLACGTTPRSTAPVTSHPAGDVDPDGPHRAAVIAQVQPWIDAELASGIVVGLYDGGKREIYGFGSGPNGGAPNGKTLFEIGAVTKIYTSLLLADAIQRLEVTLDTPVAELLPPGITVPTRDKIAITLRHLALHNSGLPRLPPTIAAHADAPDPYGGYGEEALYADLVQTQLESAPGAQITYSNYGAGLLGFALGRKIGPDFRSAVAARVLGPLALADTFLAVPPPLRARLAKGTNADLAATPAWTFDALAGAAGMISTARDQLALIDAELDAAAGAKTPLRAAMRLTQEPQLEHTGDNEGLGWQIDGSGRYWHNGGTGGFHSFVGFDPKTRRGVVILASTELTLFDHLADVMYQVVGGETPKPVQFPTAEQLAPLAGTYDLGDMKVVVTAAGKRLYLENPKTRLVPISDHEFWIEPLQSVAVFEKDGDKIARAIFVIGNRKMVAKRVE